MKSEKRVGPITGLHVADRHIVRKRVVTKNNVEEVDAGADTTDEEVRHGELRSERRYLCSLSLSCQIRDRF